MISLWEFPKIRGTIFGVLIIRILLLRVLYSDPLFLETPLIYGLKKVGYAGSRCGLG